MNEQSGKEKLERFIAVNDRDNLYWMVVDLEYRNRPKSENVTPTVLQTGLSYESAVVLAEGHNARAKGL